MTALAGGIWSPDDKPLTEAVARSMHAAMPYRGGDDVAIRREDVSFGHAHQPTPGALLSASNSACHGKQKVGETREQTVWAVVDGRIDNAQAVRLRLEAAGYSIGSSEPAEVVAALYETEGVESFSRLRGAFAIAIWDGERRELTLARDPSGQHPMYYERRAGRMVFCSELRGLRHALSAKPTLSATALDEYLTYGYVPPPHTLLQGVSKVPPGTWVRLKDGRLDSGRFDPLDLQYVLPGNRVDQHVPGDFFGDHTGKSGGVLLELVQDALEASVPAAPGYLVAPHADASDRPWQIVSVATQIRQIENGDAQASAGDAQDGEFDWLDFWSACDEPIADASVASILAAAKVANAAKIPLVTTYGGHELLACYRRHKQLVTFADKIPGWLNKFMGSDPRSMEEQAAEVRQRQREYLKCVHVFGETDRANLYSAEHLGSLADADPEDFLHLAFDRVGKREPISRAALVDWQTYVPNAQVATADWAANRFNCEVFHPFLDEDVSRLLAAANDTLRKALRESIWPTRPQAGNRHSRCLELDDVPLASLDAILNDERFLSRGYLDEGYGQMLIAYTAGGQPKADLHRQAFALAGLEVWLREILDES